MVLPTANGGDVGRNSDIDDDELFARIPFYWNSPNKCKSIA
jgi:hypothetical protein